MDLNLNSDKSNQDRFLKSFPVTGFIDALLLVLAWAYLRITHSFTDQKDAFVLIATIISLFAYLCLLFARNKWSSDIVFTFYAIALSLRSLFLCLPIATNQPINIWLFSFFIPIILLQLIAPPKKAIIGYVFIAIILCCLILFHPAPLTAVHTLLKPQIAQMVYVFTLLTQAGVFLGAYVPDPNPTFIRIPLSSQATDSGKTLTSGEMALALGLTMRVGRMMLESGAASFRTEQAMQRVAVALGVGRMETYLTPNGIVGSAYSGTEHRTQVARISRLSVAMNRVTALENYTHHLTPDTNPEEIRRFLSELEEEGSPYSKTAYILAAGTACGALAVVLGGGIWDIVAAGVGAGTSQMMRIKLTQMRMNPFLLTTLCAALATAVCLFLITLIHPVHPKAAIAASVLFLVPGVPLVTSIVDLSRLDILPGVNRGMLALMLFIGIALGMLVILGLTGYNLF
jgi:uncharacterized membrane protein YjjP (DUF1212 family)